MPPGVNIVFRLVSSLTCIYIHSMSDIFVIFQINMAENGTDKGSEEIDEGLYSRQL